MRKLILSACALALLAGCGFESRENVAIGQAKKLVQNTPIFCPNYTSLDLSLGVLRGGVGSMSTQDMWFTVADTKLLDGLRAAVDAGLLLKVSYSTRRFPFCTDLHILSGFDIVLDGGKG